MEGEEQNRRELPLPLSEREEDRVFPFPFSQRSSALRPPVGGHLLSAGGRLAPPGQSVFGKTQLWTNGGDGGGETDNVSRHRDTGCDGLKTFFPSAASRRVLSVPSSAGDISWRFSESVEELPHA